jgi:hypothetical protein
MEAFGIEQDGRYRDGGGGRPEKMQLADESGHSPGPSGAYQDHAV